MKLLFVAFLIFSFEAIGQIPASANIYLAKEFSKEIALYKAKAYLIENILGPSNSVVKYSIDPLAATNSGELTSLSYHCEEKNKEGVIFGFFGNRWNKEGVSYQAYAFKDLPKEKALEILNGLELQIKEHTKFLDVNDNNNNIYFQWEDMTFLIYRDIVIKIRVFWDSFDSEWDMVSFKRTKRRLLKKLD